MRNTALLLISLASCEVCEVFEWINSDKRGFILTEIGSKLEIDCSSNWRNVTLFKSGNKQSKNDIKIFKKKRKISSKENYRSRSSKLIILESTNAEQSAADPFDGKA
jgi:hypothetical protein